ncbi:unnamed protein product [Penicillium pancosmium]
MATNLATLLKEPLRGQNTLVGLFWVQRGAGISGRKNASCLPSDPLQRKKIDVNKLDLRKSYVGLVQPVNQVKPPRKQKEKRRTWNHIATTITDPKMIPEGWDHQEHDLDPDDLDAQIARCHERIAERILPDVFQHRLEGFLELKAAENKISDGWPKGLDKDVYQRLNSLKAIEEHLSKEGDNYKELPNVRALITAYKSGQLKWNGGLVTYWSKGLKLSEPRPFDWDEFEAINKKHDGHDAFWVEGV